MVRLHGLYRGTVRDPDDSGQDRPHRGCLKVYVPQAYGPDVKDGDLPWAEPCLPSGGGRTEDGKGLGLMAIPPKGASVWVAFEQGDPRRPVWLGTWYGEPDGVRDIPEEGERDARSGAAYPEIAFWMTPSGMSLRFIGDKRLELAFERDKTFLEMDAVRRQIKLHSDDWDVAVSTLTGKVALASGEGASQQSIRMDPRTGRMTIRAGEVRIEAANVRIAAEETFRVHAGKSSQNSSLAAGGWERH